jgi:reelin
MQIRDMCSVYVMTLSLPSNTGIRWRTIHTMEPSLYSVPRRDYIMLPSSVRTSSTSFRWWQALPAAGQTRATWAIDDVIIGGREINPSVLYEDFTDERIVGLEFFPNGRTEGGVCNRPGMSMAWEKGTGVKLVTTQPMIAQHGHIIQFKVGRKTTLH